MILWYLSFQNCFPLCIELYCINHIQTQRALTVSKERRFGKRGSPGDRRFETVLEAEYKGRHLKVRA